MNKNDDHSKKYLLIFSSNSGVARNSQWG